jgi:guanylate kinase
MQSSLEQKLANYKTPKKAIELIAKTKMVFLVGIAGAGKNTILTELLKSSEYEFIVSHTSRNPRVNLGVPEQDGIDYHFISLDQAEEMLDNQEFVEAKIVHDKIYGTSIKEIEDIHRKGKIALTDIDIQGVVEYNAISKETIPIFVLPPDFATWQQRLETRYGAGAVDADDLKKRMETAEFELQEALDKEYFEFVVNDNLDRAVNAVKEIAKGNISAKKNEEARQLAKALLVKLQDLR